MKNLHILILSLAFCVASAVASAAEIRLATADMNRLFENYHRTAEAQARFQSAVEAAQSSAETMMADGQSLVEEYRKLVDEANSPALSADARERAEARAEEKLQTIREKEREVQQFQANTQRALQQRQVNHRQLMMEEIKEVVKSIAEARGANLVLDSSDLARQGGIGGVIFVSPEFDVTEEALKELNKDQPAG